MIVGWREDRAPNDTDDLVIWRGAVEGDSLHSWAIDIVEETFERFFEKDFGLDGSEREILCVDSKISIKAPIYGGDFSSQVIRRSILTISEKWDGVVHINKAKNKKEEHTEFYMETLNREKP